MTKYLTNIRIIVMIKRTASYLVILVLNALLLSATGCTQDAEQHETAVSAKPKRPNILLIVADDMGYSDVGVFGSEI
jgi:hypothetical protein